MKRSTKIVLIATVLFTATGVAIASQGHAGDHHGGKQDMQGMKGMHSNHHAMNGMKQFDTIDSSNQLDNLSKDQTSHVEEKHSHN